MLTEFDRHYAHFREHGGKDILGKWRELSGTLGRCIKVQLRDEQVEGTAHDIDDDGSLVVDIGGGKLRSIAYGDVTILRAAARQ